MASGFTPKDGTECEGCHSNGKPRVTYCVEVKQNLCDHCAQGRHDSIKGVEKKFKWFCEKHQEKEAEIFCETHRIKICQVCAVTSGHKPCHTKDIREEVTDRKLQLQDLVKRGKDKEDEIKQHCATVDQQTLQVEEHFQTIDEDILAAYIEDTKTVEDARGDAAKMINQYADEEITKIDKKRNEHLKQNQEVSDNKLRKINSSRFHIDKEMKWLTTQLKESTKSIKSKSQSLLSTVRDACKKAEETIVQEEDLMNDFHDVTRSLTDSLQTDINKGSIDEVRRIAEKVSFVREDGERIGRIDGIGEYWELHKEYEIGKGNLKGSISKDQVIFYKCTIPASTSHCIIDVNDKSLSNKKLDDILCSCAPLNDGRIVCGTNEGTVIIYDQEWTCIRKICTPVVTEIRVSVDKDGMIIAAGFLNSTIYVLNPDDGTFVRTIHMQDHNRVHGIHALPSGDMVVHTACFEGGDVCILDASGVVKVTTHLHNKDIRGIAVDWSCDSIYILYRYHPHGDGAVDKISSSGVVVSEGILEFKLPAVLLFMSCYLSIGIPQSGKLVISNGIKLFIYRHALK